jgi:hypothetical protein
VTEQEWLDCIEPFDMADSLGDKLSDRKLRLFGCACVRGVWEHLPDDALRCAIETCERFADGAATLNELNRAREAVEKLPGGNGDIIVDHSGIAVAALCEPQPWFPMGEGGHAGISAVAAEARFDENTPWDVARAKAKQDHCELLRHIVGNPFRPYPAPPSWPSTVVQLAESLYAGQDCAFALHDALLEAGHAELAEHFREEKSHPKGCWVVDMILGKK